jgi:nucleoside-diphosphate-sugar epimerase
MCDESNIKYIFNLAAVHREPGHNDGEFFFTNLIGAENVCQFAENVGCDTIFFTSSISPYGISDDVKDENTIPIPVTAYGSSKFAAEKIHQIWQAKNKLTRRLVIVRPGVVFGPGEGGNVSRLIKAVLNRYFFYMGNKNTRKAGVYVKELCNAMFWVFSRQETTGELVSLFNMSMNPGPSISEYVGAVCAVAKVKRFIPNIPYTLVGPAKFIFQNFSKT